MAHYQIYLCIRISNFTKKKGISNFVTYSFNQNRKTITTMENTNNNLLGVWMDTQNKAIENWASTTKKYQESASKGDLLQKGMDFYKEWFENQKALVNNSVQQGTEKIAENSPEAVQNLLKQQKDFTDKWVEMMNTAFKQPKEISENWLGESKKMYDSWVDLLGKSYGNLNAGDFMTGNFTKNAFGNVMDYSKAYMSMMEVWKPFYQMVSKNQFDVNEFSKMWGFNNDASTKLQEAVQSMFGFMLPNGNLTEQFSKIMGNFSHYMNAFEPFKKGMEQFGKLDALKVDFNQMYQFQENFSRQYNKMYEPFAKLFPNNMNLVDAENMANLQNNLSKYMSKYAEMQFIIGEAARKSVELTAEKLFEAAKSGNSNQSYSEFFNTWLANVEEKMIELFNGNHFAGLQADLVGLGLDIKKMMEDNMEKSLNAYPIATRTEIDGLHKQIHELKKVVRDLQRKLGEDTIEVTETDGETKTTTRGRKK